MKITRSLKASETGLLKASNAFIAKGLTCEDFAVSLNFCRGVVEKFLKRVPIDRSYFCKICKALELNPIEIIEPITNVEIVKKSNLEKIVYNNRDQLVAWLEIENKLYLILKTNEEIYSDNIEHILKNGLEDIQADFLDILIKRLVEYQIQEKSLHIAEQTKNIVRLSNWLHNNFETGWQTIEDFWAGKDFNPSFNFRSGDIEYSRIDCAKMVKQIDSIIKEGENKSLALVVALNSTNKEKIDVLLQLHPKDENYLPFGIQLTIIDEFGKALAVAKARNDDNCIQQKINGKCGDHFSVQVALDEYNIIEHFVI
jgi:Protein of unknown function (DUF1822)